MRKIFTLALAFAGIMAANADNQVITLDLTKATTPLTFDQDNGAWTGTYNDDEEAIVSQCFSFVHSSMSDYNTWWGFTASNSADNQRQENTIKYQFINMAKGGIVLNEDGTVKTNSFGAPETSKDVPYLVAYCNAYMAARPVDLTFNDGKAYDAVGVYINLSSWPYYSIEYGDNFARAFDNGDKFTLTVHGIAPDESEKTIDVNLASYTNGNLTINRGWMYVDLTELGTVNEIYFTLKSTDSGAYGDNTPGYFCLDKLMVKETNDAGVSSTKINDASISYDRVTHIVTVDGAEFAMICDTTGAVLMSGESTTFDISNLPAGVYIVKAGDNSIKIAK